MGFFKRLKNKVRNQVLTMAEQPRRLPPIPPRSEFNPFRDPPREGRRPMPTPVNPNIQSVRDFVDNLRAQNTLEDIETGALPPAGMSMPVGPSEAMLPTAPNEAGLLPLPRPRNRFKPRNKFMPGRFRPLPQIIPERMPSRRPTPRFFGGGLRSIFAGLPQFMERFEDQRARERMSPPLPRAPLPIPEDMPTERFPMMRPGFAEGTPDGLSKSKILKEQFLRKKMLDRRDDFRRRRNLPSAFVDLPNRGRMISDVDRMIAEQAAREGISPAERRAESLKNFLKESGRNISERDAELFGMGVLSFEDVMRRAESARQTNLANEQRQNALADQGRTLSMMDRNLMQQEQMFFPKSESLDDILADLEKKN